MSDTTALLTFKAGKVDFNPPSKTLSPMPAKGKVTLARYNDEETPLLSFLWEARGSSKNDLSSESDELTIFPGEAEWLPVTQCTTGRVFVLKFNSSSQRIFFWLQNAPNSATLNELSPADKKIAKRINALLQDVYAPEDNDDDEEVVPNQSALGDTEMADSISAEQAPTQ